MAATISALADSVKNTLSLGTGSTSSGPDTAAADGTVYEGFGISDHNKWTDFQNVPIVPKTWDEDDVEIAITHCGVCGSDVHTITGGWGESITGDPLVVGHEIVGKAVRVGTNVQGIKTGDRVGVGALIGSCYECRACKSDNENYCQKAITTYAGQYPDGVKTQGGYARAIRANQQFTFPIPDALESKDAASMLCGGLTVYSPLVRNGCGPGKKVGVVGVGGLGHYAVLFAKALGAEVFAFTHSHSKDEDIKSMGADHVILTSEKDWHKPYFQQLDLIVSTRDVAEGFELSEYFSMLWVGGSLIGVGIPDEPLNGIKPQAMAGNAARLGGSKVGSKKEALEMLQLAADKKIKPWIEEKPMTAKGCAEAVEGVKDNKVRFRYVLSWGQGSHA